MGSNSFASDFSYPIMLHTISGNRSSTHSSLQQENNIMKDEIVLERYKFISLKSVSYLFLQKKKPVSYLQCRSMTLSYEWYMALSVCHMFVFFLIILPCHIYLYQCPSNQVMVIGQV